MTWEKRSRFLDLAGLREAMAGRHAVGQVAPATGLALLRSATCRGELDVDRRAVVARDAVVRGAM